MEGRQTRQSGRMRETSCGSRGGEGFQHPGLNHRRERFQHPGWNHRRERSQHPGWNHRRERSQLGKNDQGSCFQTMLRQEGNLKSDLQDWGFWAVLQPLAEVRWLIKSVRQISRGYNLDLARRCCPRTVGRLNVEFVCCQACSARWNVCVCVCVFICVCVRVCSMSGGWLGWGLWHKVWLCVVCVCVCLGINKTGALDPPLLPCLPQPCSVGAA